MADMDWGTGAGGHIQRGGDAMPNPTTKHGATHDRRGGAEKRSKLWVMADVNWAHGGAPYPTGVVVGFGA